MCSSQQRARDIGIPFDGKTGKNNAITDVEGVEVGHTTIIKGEGKLIKGEGPIRTGVTAILPGGKQFTAVFANWHMLNGNGDMTGTHWITESGFLETPILITNTGSADSIGCWYAYPLVAETYDGFLNDVNGHHVTKEHVWNAINTAKNGIVEEGNVGGGTGMVCYDFKGGIGTASRLVDERYTIGVLVQANYGTRCQLRIAGVSVGKELEDTYPVIINSLDATKQHPKTKESGSIIVIVATDAPLLPHQLKRIAHRVSLGLAILGGVGGNMSGDIFLAFSTANKNAYDRDTEQQINLYPNSQMDALFTATIQATEEAVVNAMVSAKTMKGINDNTVSALPHDAVKAILKKYKRIS
ncbi:unnamed protein product [Didymodactylos carnosus]|uniref:Aminopeptidase n=1 Tax=Didymodactylos carnosus TaxID=1234261 RepID=A0A8S2F3E5_9BILA|nr:unnamed protein product [Didymodactylos carnosus]CAF4122013.1 unnamed protein product [Didymodactylos carnosus]